MADYQVKGTLTLDTTKFDQAVEKAKTELAQFAQTVNGLKSSDDSLDGFNKDLSEAENKLRQTNSEVKKTKSEMSNLKNSANATGKSFAITSESLSKARGSLSSYNTTANLTRGINSNLSSSFGLAGRSVSTFGTAVSNTNRVLRTLKTTGSIIFGMYAYQFVDAIGKSATATIKAKSEMESYYKALKMGSVEQKQFSAMLDKTLKQYPKMNKYQLGETLSSLGVEFDLNLQQMEKIGKVAPMIINEYLRAGRSTEEAILAIKDISQGEFLRLSRETGVGKEEIKKAGWSGDLKDIEGLYDALEKVGKSRNWDAIASKASSLNDIMLITENRFGEFATDLVGAVTPAVVGAFNTIIDAMNGLENAWASLGTGGQVAAGIIAIPTIVAPAFNWLANALQNFATIRAANIMGINAEIAAEEGLSRAYAETTFVMGMEQRARQYNIETAFAETVAMQEATAATIQYASAEEELAVQRMMELMNGEEELTLKQALAQVTEELAAAREAEAVTIQEQVLAQQALAEAGVLEAGTRTSTEIEISKETMLRELNVTSLEAQKLALDAEALAMETGMSIEEARIAVINREKVANMGAAKTITTKILGLKAEEMANYGVRTAIASKIGLLDVERIREIASALATGEKTAADFQGIEALIAKRIATKLAAEAEEEEAAAAVMAEAATLGLAATIAVVAAAIAALAFVVAPIIIQFNNLSASFDKVSDSLANGQTKIDELKEKQTAYQTTINNLSNKTNRSKEETDKLNEARDGLKYTTSALKAAEEEYAYAQMVSNTYTNYSNEIEGKRYDNLKKINDELNNQQGTKGVQYTDNTYGMGSAYAESYKMLQIMNYEEDHRVERNKQLEDSLKRQGKSQSETNQMIKEYSKDWNQAYTDRELAQQRMADPNVSGFDKIGAYWDNWWASAKLSWIEFWANPWEGLGLVDSNGEWFLSQTGLDRLNDIGDMWKNNVEDPINNGIQSITDAWDNFWQPIQDFFNGLSVGSDFNPFQGIADWLNNPFGGTEGTAMKTIDLSSMFNFDFAGVKSTLQSGWNNVMNSVNPILQGAGRVWSQISNFNGSNVVSSFRNGVSHIGSTAQSYMSQVTTRITSAGSSWYTGALNSAKRVIDAVKSGLSGIGDAIKGKLSDVTSKIRNIGKEWFDAGVAAISQLWSGLTSSGPSISLGFGGPKPRRIGRIHRIPHNNPPAYGPATNFESTLRTMLTAQGFRNPNSYEYYANSMKTNQETWDSGKANCYDGAELILGLGQMFGLSGHLVHGSWNGSGHAAAIVGGKLYDMTQFQKRGVFRGTQGVSFGSGGGQSYGNTNHVKNITLHIYNDLSNSRIYGIDDLDNHIRNTTEETVYSLHSTDGAVGY